MFNFSNFYFRKMTSEKHEEVVMYFHDGGKSVAGSDVQHKN